MGRGSYGIVWKAIDKVSRETIALKKCFDAFTNAYDAQKMYREITLLQQLSDHPNIIKLENILKSENNRDIYLILEIMESDLHAVLRADILQEIHKKYIIYQLLKAVKYIHSAGVVHRDLKPANILINTEC